MQERRWVLREVDESVVNHLHESLKIHPVLCRLLAGRGIHSFEEAKAFFRPSLDDLHDPFLMKDMDRAVERVRQALSTGEKILVYGDYDVDGTTAVALVTNALSPHYKALDFYVPDRQLEGYGISFRGIDYAAQNGCSLIIALDCGIRAVDKVEYAARHRVDVIICDHHLPGDERPRAAAILDPKQPGCPYPYKELTGCGIGFKLMHALALRNGWDTAPLFDQLDLLVVSIAADIVPITGENRVLARFGLDKLNTHPQPGLKTLMEVSGLNAPLTISNVVFGIAPRINAAGRLEHARFPVQLLTGREPQALQKLAARLHATNRERQDLDKAITSEALEYIRATPGEEERFTTVVRGKGWHKGVVGIVASRLIEHYYRPTVVLSEADGMLTGSARSVPGFDLFAAVSACSRYLERFGGHTHAAGLTLASEQYDAFRETFEQYVRNHITEEQRIPVVLADAVLPLTEVKRKLYNIIEQMAPFGPGNMRPVFIAKKVRDTGSARVLKDEHLKMYLKQGSAVFDAIAFGMAHHYDTVSRGPVDICYTIDLNQWNGRESLQLRIKDLKPCET